MFDRQWQWVRKPSAMLFTLSMAFLLVSCDETGAAGARGASGPPGPRGAQGPPGPAGSGASLALVDAKEQLVGPVILSFPLNLQQFDYVVVSILGTPVALSLIQPYGASSPASVTTYVIQDAVTTGATAHYFHTAPDCSDPRLALLQPLEQGFVWGGIVYYPNANTGVVDGGSIAAYELVAATNPGQSFSQIGTCTPFNGYPANQFYGPLTSTPLLPNFTPPFSIQIR